MVELTKELSNHSVAAIFPDMEPDEFGALKASMTRDGFHLDEPIVRFKGLIVDGRHRYRAARELGITPLFTDLPETSTEQELAEFVWQRNFSRRHLNVTAKAAALERYAQFRPEAGRPKKAARGELLSQTEAAALAGVSVPTLKRIAEMRKAVEAGHAAPELYEGLRQGKIAPNTAVTLLDLRVEEQKLVADKARTEGEKAGVRAAAEVKRHQKYGRLIEAGTPSMDHLERFAVVLADPPWRFEESTISLRRQVENHYPTMPIDEIISLGDKLKAHLLPDAALFLWALASNVDKALAVLRAWSFDYRTQLVWTKSSIGMGSWVRTQHEVLLLGVKGDMPTPSPAARPSSVIEAPRREHSRKPDECYALIERMFPEIPKLELFARRQRPGWMSWGNEIGIAAA